MKKWSAWLFAVAMLLCRCASAQPEPLTVGIIPYLSPKVLIGLFQPLRAALAGPVGRPVELYTAPDTKTFLRRTLKADFDLVVTPAHQARLAQIEAGYLPLVRFSGPLHAALAVGGTTAIRGLADLRGKRVAFADRTNLVTIVALLRLADQGIGEADLELVPAGSMSNALLALKRGETDAAIVAHYAFDQTPAEQRRGLRLAYLSETLPGVTLLARPGLPASEREAIRQALLHLGNTPQGAEFLAKSRYQGVLPADEAFMRQADPYLAETRRQLGP